MCELCELKAKADKAKEAMQFRIVQMQMEIQEGRDHEAQEAKRLARDKFEELLTVVQEHAEKVKSGDIERHHMSPLEDLLGGGLLN